ncbi:MAG: hypothetical protein Q9219_002897 [cf. Caloplaca sp. 3 TL-2023]
MPILAYCIISAEYELSDTTDSLLTLLAMGANPYDLPQDMWCNCIETPRMAGPEPAHALMIKYPWCSSEIRAALCRSFNLLQRYHVKMASLLPPKTPREQQAAETFNLVPFFEVPFHLLGQRLAVRTVQEWLMSYAMHHIEMPLVLCFCGPSGHGKTELAKRMGELLSLPFLKVDCTHLRHETDLFGAQAPYQGWRTGSLLNNFLTDWSGQRAVVFLDEFDKMNSDVYKSLLLLFDEGFYKDRRAQVTQVDSSKIIWVLASNNGDGIIQKWWDANLADKTEELQLSVPIDSLQQALEVTFRNSLGAPLTGRISTVIPFMPFNSEERAVTAYKFMRKIFNDSRKPVSVEEKHLARHIYLHFIDDGNLASQIAQMHYSADLGARSLLKGVNTAILHKLNKAWSGHGKEITDKMNSEPLECYDVRLEDLKEGGAKLISIKANGTRSVQRRMGE